MATNKNSDKEKKTTVQNSPAPDKQSAGKKQENGPSRNILGLAALTLAILIGILSIYLTYYITAMDRGINEELEMSNNTIASLMDQQKNLQDAFKTQQESLKKQINAYDEKINILNEKVKQTLDERGYQKEDWQLLKARYFLEMAKINTHWQQNPVVSRRMLEQADNLLKSIPDPALYSIRQTIAHEIQQIDKLDQPDKIGMLSQLDAIQAEIEKLPVVPVKLPVKRESPNSKEESDTNWRDQWSKSVNLLEKLVVIRHHHEDTLALLPPEEKQLLKQRLHLSLQQAQMAILQGDEDVFQLAIRQSLQQLARFSADAQTDTASIKRKLQELEKKSIRMQQAPTGEALKALNDYIAKKRDKNAAVPAVSENENENEKDKAE